MFAHETDDPSGGSRHFGFSSTVRSHAGAIGLGGGAFPGSSIVETPAHAYVTGMRRGGLFRARLMWRPHSQVGLVALQAPGVRKMNHPVPLLPTKHPEGLA